jgi:hypothetical protein
MLKVKQRVLRSGIENGLGQAWERSVQLSFLDAARVDPEML